jgi:flagellar hook-length control protein FliK
MDSWLASIYGTGGGQDIEKTAQVLMLEKLANEAGISLEQLQGLTPEQLEMLAAEVMGPQAGAPGAGGPAGGAIPGAPQPGMPGQAPVAQQAPMGAQQQQVPPAAPQPGEGAIKTAEAIQKFEEADFLGRVMAHAYTQEIEKIAASKTAGVIPGDPTQGTVPQGAVPAPGVAPQAAQQQTTPPPAGGAFAGAPGAGQTKLAQAITKLATLRAREILTQNGINPDNGQAAQAPAAAQPVTTGAPAPLAQAVEQQAVEILKEAGYRFE